MPTVASDPYRWPFAGDLAGERLAVVVTGAQPWCTRDCPGWPAALAVLTEVVGAARAAGALVVWVAHHRPRPAPAGRVGAGLPAWASAEAALVATPAPTDLVVPAGGVDGFYAGPLDAVLRGAGRSQLVLAGAGLETTVHSTLRSANDRGYECLTLLDAAAAVCSDLAGAAASTICLSGGVFGAVATSPTLLAALAGLRAGLPADPADPADPATKES